MPAASSADLVERTAATLRSQLIEGRLLPGQQLIEPALTAELAVSRNTLRESFRILMHEGLLVRHPNRGVFVLEPGVADILDIYRVRRVIEGQAVRLAVPRHPAIRSAAEAVDAAERARDEDDWQLVGTMNMAFHAALVELADSERLTETFARLQAELRLAFTTLASPEFLHAPFIDENRVVVRHLQAGDMAAAADALDAYFTRSERTVLAAIGRRA
ncbi:GntR family transcriptional regulator [Homoserinibacter sp. YIM 151385]|uniref:GntR family transcriptional regulator n=1 Tax=Homoserinibacter sp. YIM 151385 TaxID=2985506 RepID=UPI0022F0C9DB|nr:GntR family transcriptional regulator [Homoserinibacter sp. YIM 151385]WBU37880.1 GntR family transcriptional regulator [Homoserinibacter sp. YIM 151385]